jgi:hypothetical protein
MESLCSFLCYQMYNKNWEITNLVHFSKNKKCWAEFKLDLNIINLLCAFATDNIRSTKVFIVLFENIKPLFRCLQKYIPEKKYLKICKFFKITRMLTINKKYIFIYPIIQIHMVSFIFDYSKPISQNLWNFKILLNINPKNLKSL